MDFSLEFTRRLVRNLVGSLSLDQAIQHSCRDFHTEWVDYICLHRTKELTVKVYFLGEGVPLFQNVVNPHDHAYNFSTFVLNGTLANVNFFPAVDGEEWHKHDYTTPLRGSPSISFDRVVKLREEERRYESGEHYYLDRAQVHTIRACSKDVVMLLFQYRTEVEQTSLFLPDLSIPIIQGLYRPFSKEEMTIALERLKSFL